MQGRGFLVSAAPTKYTFVVNFATARKLDLGFRSPVPARADEVIE